MPSPFPGMDPYLEDPRRWGGVHMRLIVEVSNQLIRTLPDGLTAEIDQYVSIEEAGDDGEDGRRNPDVFVYDLPGGSPLRRNGAAAAVMEPPTARTILLPGNVVKHRRLLIQTLDGKKILTAVEILSPSNKEGGPDREAYLAKRNQYLAAGTNLVEIDLLRSGSRMPFGRPAPPVADYYILVSTAAERPATSIWAFTVRQRIPVVPLPLSPKYGPVPLDLHACLNTVHAQGGYDRKLAYSQQAVPPLNQPDAEWAADILKKPAKKRRK